MTTPRMRFGMRLIPTRTAIGPESAAGLNGIIDGKSMHNSPWKISVGQPMACVESWATARGFMRRTMQLSKRYHLFK